MAIEGWRFVKNIISDLLAYNVLLLLLNTNAIFNLLKKERKNLISKFSIHEVYL